MPVGCWARASAVSAAELGLEVKSAKTGSLRLQKGGEPLDGLGCHRRCRPQGQELPEVVNQLVGGLRRC